MYVNRYQTEDFRTMSLRDLAWVLNNLEADAENAKSSMQRTEFNMQFAAADENVSEERKVELSDRLHERCSEYRAVVAQLEAAFDAYRNLFPARDF